MIECKFVELHSPLFLGGTNLTAKLDHNRRSGLYMEYDRVEKELHVQYNGQWAIIPTNNIASMIPSQENLFTAPIKPVTAPKPFAPQGKFKAQVSTPINVGVDK